MLLSYRPLGERNVLCNINGFLCVHQSHFSIIVIVRVGVGGRRCRGRVEGCVSGDPNLNYSFVFGIVLS